MKKIEKINGEEYWANKEAGYLRIGDLLIATVNKLNELIEVVNKIKEETYDR